jgi:hypothetical protein
MDRKLGLYRRWMARRARKRATVDADDRCSPSYRTLRAFEYQSASKIDGMPIIIGAEGAPIRR